MWIAGDYVLENKFSTKLSTSCGQGYTLPHTTSQKNYKHAL